MTDALAQSFGREIDDLACSIQDNWSWPSPDSALASHFLRIAGLELPSVSEITNMCPNITQRMDEAPVLAATGYMLDRRLDTNQDFADAWAEGMARLSTREAFPADRASFVFRPAELLGISLGAVNCSAVQDRQRAWIRDILMEAKPRLASGESWAFMLGAYAAQVVSEPWGELALPRFAEMKIEELSLLKWIQDSNRLQAEALVATEQGRDLENEILVRCATQAIRIRDVAQTAAVYAALRKAVVSSIESEYERHWQTGRESVDALSLVTTICARFHLFARQLLTRREGRSTIAVSDEYDVQDLMYAMLKLHFDDVRPEEWTPSYAGNSSRMDFLLKPERLVIETKMTRKNLGQKQIAEELTIDKDRYRSHPDCETLVAFVYDPEGRCPNPTALESDLSSNPNGLRVSIIVAPKGN